MLEEYVVIRVDLSQAWEAKTANQGWGAADLTLNRAASLT
jgi:hypothetical protein